MPSPAAAAAMHQRCIEVKCRSPLKCLTLALLLLLLLCPMLLLLPPLTSAALKSNASPRSSA
jgi:hypothetical protein